MKYKIHEFLEFEDNGNFGGQHSCSKIAIEQVELKLGLLGLVVGKNKNSILPFKRIFLVIRSMPFEELLSQKYNYS